MSVRNDLPIIYATTAQSVVKPVLCDDNGQLLIGEGGGTPTDITQGVNGSTITTTIGLTTDSPNLNPAATGTLLSFIKGLLDRLLELLLRFGTLAATAVTDPAAVSASLLSLVRGVLSVFNNFLLRVGLTTDVSATNDTGDFTFFAFFKRLLFVKLPNAIASTGLGQGDQSPFTFRSERQGLSLRSSLYTGTGAFDNGLPVISPYGVSVRFFVDVPVTPSLYEFVVEFTLDSNNWQPLFNYSGTTATKFTTQAFPGGVQYRLTERYANGQQLVRSVNAHVCNDEPSQRSAFPYFSNNGVIGVTATSALGLNPQRKKFQVCNVGVNPIFLDYVSTVSSALYMVQIPPGATYTDDLQCPVFLIAATGATSSALWRDFI
jgi:hypothetical protein